MTAAPLLALPARWLLPLLVALLALTGVLVQHLLEVRHLVADVTREERARLLERLTLEQTRLELGLRQANLLQVRRAVSALGLIPAVSGAWLVDADGQVRAALTRFAIGQPFGALLAGQPPALVGALEHAWQSNGLAIRIDELLAARLLVGRLGIAPGHVLLVTLDLDVPVAARLHAARGRLWREAVITLAFAGLLGLLLHVLWARRLSRLTEAVAALGAGRLETRAGLGGRDELATIGAAIDQMAGRLQAGETRLRQLAELIERSPVVAITWRNAPGWPVEFISGNLTQWGWREADLQGGRLRYADLIHHEDRRRVATAVAAHLADGPDEWLLEYRLRRADGEYRRVEDRTRLSRGADGTVCALAGILIDVTERHQLSTARQQSEARFRAMAEDLPLLLCRLLPDLRIEYVNPAYCDYFGRGADELVGTSFLQLIPVEDRLAVATAISGLSPAAPTGTHEHRVLTPDGQLRWQRWSNRAMFDAAGRLLAYQAIGEDVTERKRAEAALAVSEARYRDAQRAAHVGSWELDLSADRLWWSEETYRIFGLDPDAFTATYRGFLDHVHPEDREQVEAAFTSAVSRGESYNITHRVILPDGQVKHVRERGEVQYDGDGRALRAVGTVQDVSELEEQVRLRTAELAAANRELEMFSYSVSHDLKAPLRGIDGYSRLLLADHGDRLDEEGRLFLTNIRAGVAQMNQLIADLLAYSRMERRALAPVALDLSALVARVLAERAAEIAEQGLAVTTTLADERVCADPDGLALALRNLLDNALKFTRGTAAPRLSISAMTGAESVTLCVADNGVGFDMRFHDQLFDIFQRLQRAEDYPGTGVGLAIVRKAMQRMGGRVWAEGRPGAGASFYLELPR